MRRDGGCCPFLIAANSDPFADGNCGGHEVPQSNLRGNSTAISFGKWLKGGSSEA